MSRRQVVRGLGVVAVLAVVALLTGRWGEPAGKAGEAGQRSATLARRGAPAPAPRQLPEAGEREELPRLAARAPSSEEELVAAATLISVSAQPAPAAASERAAFAAAAPALHVFEGAPHRAAALAQWQRLARAALRACALPLSGTAARRAVDLDVELAAAPRPQDAHWLYFPKLVGVTLEGLRALADRYEPFALQACVRRALTAPLRLPLAAGERAPPSLRALERVSTEL